MSIQNVMEQMKKKETPKKVLPEKIKKGSKEEADFLMELQEDMKSCDLVCVDYFSKLMNDKNFGETQIDQMTMYYNRMLLQQCIEPLSKGVDKESLTQTIGMYAGACLINPQFRTQCKDGIGNTLYPVFDKLSKMSSGPGHIFWEKQKERIVNSQNYGYLPLDPRSTAVMHLALNKQFFDDCRKEGADLEELTAAYSKNHELLYRKAEKDGCDLEEAARYERFIVGSFIEKDPANALMFNELTYAGVTKSDFKNIHATVFDENLGIQQSMEQIWSGEFERPDGTAYTTIFTPRVPQGVSEYHKLWSNFYNQELQYCDNLYDIADMDKNDVHLANRDLYIQMMMQDKIPLEEIQKLIIESKVNCLGAWKLEHPEVMAEMTEKGLPEDFDVRYAEFSSKFDDLFERWEQDGANVDGFTSTMLNHMDDEFAMD